MYDIGDLFDKQSTVGARLEAVLEERGYTKVKFCSTAKISRPTLDKLLSGSITSRTNYEKHMTKVLETLNMTPDMLIGRIQTQRIQTQRVHNQVRTLRNQMRMKEKELAEYIGVPIERIREIEAGEEATLAELRDIAVVLDTSVRNILEKNYFPLQNTFWGHVGIQPLESDRFLWYPITADTRKIIWQEMEEKYQVIPCMNNKVLLLNMDKIAEIVLLDDASDQPSFANWDPQVDCGGTPLVFYEALDDYLMYQEMGEEPPEDIISGKLKICLANFRKKWGDDEIYYRDELQIYCPNGKVKQRDICLGENENISTNIFHIYAFGGDVVDEKFFYGEDLNGAECFFNIENISMIEVSLVKMEEALEQSVEMS